MVAMIVKEFRQLRRDRRTVALLLVMPLLFLTVFGYAASFDVSEVRTVVVGAQAEAAAERLPEQLDVEAVRPDDTRDEAEATLRRGDATVAVLTGDGAPTALVDGSDLFAARAVTGALQAQGATVVAAAAATGPHGAQRDTPAAVPTQSGGAPAGQAPQVEVLYNPDLETAPIMIPGLVGLILVFVGTVATSLGVVRERQAGTMETLAVMPLRPRDVFIGKILPYLGIAALDTIVIVLAGLWLFDVPFRGDVLTFALGTATFLFVTLGFGVLVSSVSQNQGQAIQLAIMTLLPQVLLSGLIFPVSSMAAGVRPIAYVLPLTWFVNLSRGVMVRGATFGEVLLPLAVLAGMAVLVFTAAVVRFRRELLPRARRSGARVETVEVAA